MSYWWAIKMFLLFNFLKGLKSLNFAYIWKVYRISSNFDVCFLLNGLDCIGSKGKHKKGHSSSKNCRKIVIIELNLDFHNVHLHSDQERGNEYVPLIAAPGLKSLNFAYIWKVYRISSNFDVCVFCWTDWIVLRAFGSILMDLIYNKIL
jgi:hypothetical protein